MTDELKLGHHKPKERQEFIERKTTAYLKRHPRVKRQKARKYAKVKWARKLDAEAEALKHKNPIRLAK